MSSEQRAVTAETLPTDEAALDQIALAEDVQHLRALLDAEDIEGARRFVKELEARWPDSERVRHYAHVLAPPTVRRRSDIQGRPLDKEWEWLRQHAHEYPGCWLAVLGGRLIAADPDGSVVRARAREVPGEDRPIIFYQPNRTDHE